MQAAVSVRLAEALGRAVREHGYTAGRSPIVQRLVRMCVNGIPPFDDL